MTRAALLLLALPLPGCFLARDTINAPIQPARVAQLQSGVTTAAQALEILGGPVEVVQLGRRSAWRYDHVRTKRTGASILVATAINEDTQEDRLWLFFDEHDVLKHYGATLTASGAEWVLPWEASHE